MTKRMWLQRQTATELVENRLHELVLHVIGRDLDGDLVDVRIRIHAADEQAILDALMDRAFTQLDRPRRVRA